MDVDHRVVVPLDVAEDRVGVANHRDLVGAGRCDLPVKSLSDRQRMVLVV